MLTSDILNISSAPHAVYCIISHYEILEERTPIFYTAVARYIIGTRCVAKCPNAQRADSTQQTSQLTLRKQKISATNLGSNSNQRQVSISGDPPALLLARSQLPPCCIASSSRGICRAWGLPARYLERNSEAIALRLRKYQGVRNSEVSSS